MIFDIIRFSFLRSNHNFHPFVIVLQMMDLFFLCFFHTLSLNTLIFTHSPSFIDISNNGNKFAQTSPFSHKNGAFCVQIV